MERANVAAGLRRCAAKAAYVAAVTACAIFSLVSSARAALPERGTVVDAANGLPLVDAMVRAGNAIARTDNAGAFTIDVETANGALQVVAPGYEPVIVAAQGGATITVALTRAPDATRVIAVTATRRSDALQQASTISRTVSSQTAIATGNVRLADSLRQLPAVNNGIVGNTAALGDDINLSIRGIGTLETVAAIDGHTIAYGIKGGYNAQLSPAFPFRAATVYYGSGGSDLLGVNAIGGVVDYTTLEPTALAQSTVSQGFGTFSRLATSATITGTQGRLGYALAYGSSGLDGPFRHDSFYQSGAAYDPSAPVTSPVHALGIYEDDGGVTSRAGLVKLRWSAPHDEATFTSVASSYWENKTGNGDGDYLNYAPALAFGQLQLANKGAKDACPSGTFTAINPSSGTVMGFGPGKVPDGGVTCQTPQQYAAFLSGWQGAGLGWQAFRLNDEHLAYRHSSGATHVLFDAYTTGYDDTVDRLDQLPFKAVFGDRGKNTYYVAQNAGAAARERFDGSNNDVELGYQYLNSAYVTAISKRTGRTASNTFAHETAVLLRDAYHPIASPLSAYLDLYAKHASQTNTSYLDGRLATQLRAGRRDIVRAALGTTTTQPSADMIGQPFVEGNFGIGGGAPVNCGGLNSLGSAPSSVVKPERGVDEEFAIAHAFDGGSQTQLSLYNVHVYGKLYATIVPLAATGTSFIDPVFLSSAQAYIVAKCGAGVDANALLGTTGNFNVGTLHARGFDLAGRWIVGRRSSIDYDWALTSTTLQDLDTATLQSNLTYIVGDQVPRLPLHTLSLGYERRLGSVEARYMLHTISANNTKALPAYDYSSLSIAANAAPTLRVTMSVENLFNQWASIAGLQYEGVPLPLNHYAPASAYATYTGASATERFGLPYRSIYFNVEFRP